MALIELTKDNFDHIIESNDIVVIDFWAKWCGPCVAFAPIYQEVAESYPDVIFGKIDIETQSDLAADFNVRSIPLIMVLRQSIVVFSEAGTLPASALGELVTQAKNLDMDKVRQDIESQRQG